MASDILQIFTKYNKNYQNVSKRLQLTTVNFLTLKGHLARTVFDFDITPDSMDTPTTGGPLNTDSGTGYILDYNFVISLFQRLYFYRDNLIIT
jgi:hypothetical protein